MIGCAWCDLNLHWLFLRGTGRRGTWVCQQSAHGGREAQGAWGSHWQESKWLQKEGFCGHGMAMKNHSCCWSVRDITELSITFLRGRDTIYLWGLGVGSGKPVSTEVSAQQESSSSSGRMWIIRRRPHSPRNWSEALHMRGHMVLLPSFPRVTS